MILFLPVVYMWYMKSLFTQSKTAHTLFSSLLSPLHLEANCLVTSCLEGSAPVSEFDSATTKGLCSWQNWKNALHGFLGALGSFSGCKMLETS